MQKHVRRLALLALTFAATVLTAHAQEAGISRALAASRAARIADTRYKLSFNLADGKDNIAGTETLTFQLTPAAGQADLPLDFRDGILLTAKVNQQPIPVTMHEGHLTLPGTALHAGANEVQLTYKVNAAPAGKAITRYTDRDDGKQYLYTLFVPMDADMAFPCFDQPDLKARFTLSVAAAPGLTVIGNTQGTPAASADHTEWTFPETRAISTYLFAFAAGPFARIAPAHAGEPAVYVRASQLARAQAEAPEVQAIASSGIASLSTYFAQPFPFPKYDLVLIPGFPFGGMEHAGASFLNEDGVLFRSTPTASDYFRRDILVLHETTHQWFGDLVTMRWFDDLWLKEGFAQYMAYRTMAQLKPETNPWKHFYEDIKPLAYGIDETEGTTPIYQTIPNLKDAKSAYGAIVYQKAPAVLKQLEYFLGDDNFRDGLRLYLKQHAYSNAQWSDLIGAFEATGHKDVQSWAKAWILERGMPQVEANYTCSEGRYTSFTLTQKDVLGTRATWPMSHQILLLSSQFARDASGAVTHAAVEQKLPVQWNGATTTVPAAVGKLCSNLVFPNEDDYGYGRFLLDPSSAAVAAGLLNPQTPHEGNPEMFRAVDDKLHPLRASLLWGALWENVRIAQSPPADYVQLALASLPTETDESISRVQGGRIATSLHFYLSTAARDALAPKAEAVVADRMLHAPTLGLRINALRTFTGTAQTPAALAQQKAILNGSLNVPGLTLKPLDRWNLIGHLIAQHDPDAQTLYAAEAKRDSSGEGQKYAYTVLAATPDAAIKARYFDEYLHSTIRQEDWITQSLGPFNSWNQTALTGPYLTQALDALPSIKRDRKIFFLGAWLGAFIGGQSSPQADAAVHAWLARPGIDPDLRLKVLENVDALDRTVRIRQRFPE